MDLRAAMLAGRRRHAKLDEAFKWNAWERAHKPLEDMALSKTPGSGDRCFASGIASVKLRINERKELVNWTEQIRHRCGKELLSRGMFPPRKYFTSGE